MTFSPAPALVKNTCSQVPYENTRLEEFFDKYRRRIVGIDHALTTPYHQNAPLVYTDWTASGRGYQPIEDRLSRDILPLVANTHTDTNATGSTMTRAYHEAQRIIKTHVNANDTDVLISAGSGMTGVVNKLQRILGLRIHESFREKILPETDRPVVFVSHLEHHSNQTSWLETLAEVVIVQCDEEGLICLDAWRETVARYADRSHKIASVTACSNVTGICTPYHEIAEIIHAAGGYCFVDFACSAPYVDMDMHPPGRPEAGLDAIFFSPHKFLGGPGSTGIVVFNRALYHNRVPDNSGGGTVEWTNPWGSHYYTHDIEAREDGGTPPFLQTMRVALSIRLKEEMGTHRMQAREKEQMDRLWKGLDGIENLHILAGQHRDRLGIISFTIDGLHHNAAVKLLNDRYGIQTRGGCSCAGTYGHHLLNMDRAYSEEMLRRIDAGENPRKPGWIRLSIHPTTTNAEIEYVVRAIQTLAADWKEWLRDYELDGHGAVSAHRTFREQAPEAVFFRPLSVTH